MVDVIILRQLTTLKYLPSSSRRINERTNHSSIGTGYTNANRLVQLECEAVHNQD